MNHVPFPNPDEFLLPSYITFVNKSIWSCSWSYSCGDLDGIDAVSTGSDAEKILFAKLQQMTRQWVLFKFQWNPHQNFFNKFKNLIMGCTFNLLAQFANSLLCIFNVAEPARTSWKLRSWNSVLKKRSASNSSLNNSSSPRSSSNNSRGSNIHRTRPGGTENDAIDDFSSSRIHCGIYVLNIPHLTARTNVIHIDFNYLGYSVLLVYKFISHRCLKIKRFFLCVYSCWISVTNPASSADSITVCNSY